MSTGHQRWVLPRFGADWEIKGQFGQPSFRTHRCTWGYLPGAVTYLLLSHFEERLGADIQAPEPTWGIAGDPATSPTHTERSQ